MMCLCAVCLVWKNFVSGKLFGMRVYEILTAELIQGLAAHVWWATRCLSLMLNCIAGYLFTIVAWCMLHGHERYARSRKTAQGTFER
jgi:hypothetical protein